jgi:endo-1,4-beta-xylanase
MSTDPRSQACLYASNCDEFINWDTRDDESWGGGTGAGTLYDGTGKPKLAAYELQARFARYIAGRPELCATALGNSSCTASY